MEPEQGPLHKYQTQTPTGREVDEAPQATV